MGGFAPSVLTNLRGMVLSGGGRALQFSENRSIFSVNYSIKDAISMTVRIRSLSCISTATLLLLWNAAFSYPQTAPDTRIIPTLSVTPNLAAVGQASQVLFTITNQ